MTENTSLKIESKRYNVMKKEKEKFFRFWTENQYRLLLMYTGFQNKRSSQLHRATDQDTTYQYYIQCYQMKKEGWFSNSIGFVKRVEKTPQNPHENSLLNPLKAVINKSFFPTLKPKMFKELMAKHLKNEWIKKMWYIYTMEYYSALKRNEIGSFVETWMDLETVIQSEVSQKEKNKYRILTHICGT